MSPGSFENLEAFSGTSLPFPDSLASSICLRRGYLWEQYLFLTWYLLHHAVHVEEGIWLQGLLLFIFHCFHHSSSNQLFWLSGAQTLTPWDTLTWWRDGFQRRKSNSSGLLPPGGFPGTRQIQQVYCYLCLAMAGGSGPEASSSCCSLLSCQCWTLSEPGGAIVNTIYAHECGTKEGNFLAYSRPGSLKADESTASFILTAHVSLLSTCLLAFSHWDMN